MSKSYDTPASCILNSCGVQIMATVSRPVVSQAASVAEPSTRLYTSKVGAFRAQLESGETQEVAGGVSAIGPSAPRERGNARAGDGERVTARFRPHSLVGFSVPARPSLHRIDFLLLLKRCAETFCRVSHRPCMASWPPIDAPPQRWSA